MRIKKFGGKCFVGKMSLVIVALAVIFLLVEKVTAKEEQTNIGKLIHTIDSRNSVVFRGLISPKQQRKMWGDIQSPIIFYRVKEPQWHKGTIFSQPIISSSHKRLKLSVQNYMNKCFDQQFEMATSDKIFMIPNREHGLKCKSAMTLVNNSFVHYKGVIEEFHVSALVVARPTVEF